MVALILAYRPRPSMVVDYAAAFTFKRQARGSGSASPKLAGTMQQQAARPQNNKFNSSHGSHI